MKWTDFHINITIENLLHMMGCPPGSGAFDEMAQDWEEMRDEVSRELVPAAAAAFSRLPAEASNGDIPEGTPVLYVILTAGGGISRLSGDYFASGNYVKGMLADTAGDDALFQMDRQLEEKVAALCREKGYGILKRIEAPVGIGMEAQKAALDAILGEEELPVRINESYMYDPVKTLCQIFLLDENSREYHTGHNCMECGNISCKIRRVERFPVHVTMQEERREIICREGQSLGEALREYGIYPGLVCGGRGSCGKCGILLLKGSLPITEADRIFYSPDELKNGYRLSCMAYPEEEIHIAVTGDSNLSLEAGRQNHYETVTEYRRVSCNDTGHQDSCGEFTGEDSLGIAIDIGSTTIVMQLVSLKDRRVIDTCTSVNSQRSFGADVISRIQASNAGKGQELQNCILKDLAEGIRKLVKENGRRIRKIAAAGNTTMIHLLLGESCEQLGVYPFRPVKTCAVHTDTGSLFGGLLTGGGKPENVLPDNIPVYIYPGISAFVGGDIVSGLVHCGLAKREEISLFVDLGTNGEMALGNRDRIIVSSAAAGPAFEGGNISCGTGSIPGAVCDVTLTHESCQLTTIGNQLPPVGICGTGVVALTSELVREGIVDETGLLEDDYFETGFPLDDEGRIILTQKDIRELQLAKSAVRAGVEILLEKRGISWSQVSTLYLAGGFGYQLDIARAVTLGLLPKELEHRVVTVGNSSLAGAVEYLCREDCGKDIAAIAGICEEINLAEDMKFQELFTDYMYF